MTLLRSIPDPLDSPEATFGFAVDLERDFNSLAVSIRGAEAGDFAGLFLVPGVGAEADEVEVDREDVGEEGIEGSIVSSPRVPDNVISPRGKFLLLK